jgi:hypothetical protein
MTRSTTGSKSSMSADGGVGSTVACWCTISASVRPPKTRLPVNSS